MNKNKNRFSIIIPLYNKEKHIKRSVISVLEQTCMDFELIIVDDGSTDDSLVIVKQISDPRIVIIEQNNSGVSVARNRGIEAANYDYIGFLDADDTWEPNFLENITTLIEKYPSAGAYATAYQIHYKNDNIHPTKHFTKSFPSGWIGIVDDYFKYAIKQPLISASSVVIPKKVFNVVGVFPVGIKRGEDLEMWRKIALKYAVAYCNNISATYYHDSENRACESKVSLDKSSVSFSESLFSEGMHFGFKSVFYKEYLVQDIYIKAKYLIRDGKKEEARLLLYKYRRTKYNKKLLLKTLVKSFIL